MSKQTLTIKEKLTAIQSELKVKKSRFNSFGKYNFRSAEDILESLKPLLSKYKCVITIEEDFINPEPIPMLKSKAILSDNNESISATSIVGVDLDQKGMQVSQQFGATSSYGKKYALGNLFAIDDTADADATNTHGREVNKLKSVTSKVIDNISKAISNGKIKKDINEINKTLNKTGYENMTQEQFGKL